MCLWEETMYSNKNNLWVIYNSTQTHSGEWKSGLKLKSKKTKITASGPITSWQIDGGTVETWQTLFLGGSKIIADGDCSHEVKRCLFLGRKAMINPYNVLKSRDITLLTKAYIVKGMVFLVVMCGCDSWTIKKVEYRELMLLNCGVGEDSWESLGLQEDQSSQS